MSVSLVYRDTDRGITLAVHPTTKKARAAAPKRLTFTRDRFHDYWAAADPVTGGTWLIIKRAPETTKTPATAEQPSLCANPGCPRERRYASRYCRRHASPAARDAAPHADQITPEGMAYIRACMTAGKVLG